MKKLLVFPTFVLTLFTFCACQKSKSNSPSHIAPQASIMFINGCTGVGGLLPVFSNASLPGVSSIGMGSTTAYISVTLDTLYPPVAIGFQNPSAGNVTLVSTNYPCLQNEHYSMFVGGTVTAPIFNFVKDNSSTPGGRMARIRFANLTSNLTNASFNLGSSTIFSGVNPGTVTPFADVSSGTTAYKTFDPANETATETIFGDRTLDAGSCYTVYLIGSYPGAGATEMTLAQVTNF